MTRSMMPLFEDTSGKHIEAASAEQLYTIVNGIKEQVIHEMHPCKLTPDQ